MRILLTGSSGYIGTRLVAPLQEAGHEVRGIDRAPPSGAPAPDEFCRADLLDDSARTSVLDGADCVMHLAASRADWGISEEGYRRDNFEATRALLSDGEQRDIQRWIFFSSVSAMGPSSEGISEEAGLDPSEPYGRSKADAERLFHRFAESSAGAAVTVVRPSVVFGPGNPEDTNVYRLIEALYKRRFLMVGDGFTRKSTSYIENLVAATMFLFRRLDSGLSTYIYVDEPVLTTGTLIEGICEDLDRNPPSWSVPLWMAAPLAYVADLAAAGTGTDLPITADRIQKFCRSTDFDGSAIRRAGFRQPVPNRQAVRRTVKWYLRERASGSP